MRDHDWPVRKLGDLIAEGRGTLQTGPFGAQLHASEYVAHGVPVVMPQDMPVGLIDEVSVARIRETKAATLARHRMAEGDVVFSRRGDLSRCAVIEGKHVGWVCGTGCLLCHPNHAPIHGPWLARVYRHDRTQRQVAGLAVGTTMPNLNTGILSRLEVLCPPLAEQQQIAAVIDTIDDAIRKTEQIIGKLKQIKQGLLHDLLTRGINDNGELRDPVSHPEQFKDSALGRIPKAWRVSNLGSEFSLQRGFDITVDEQRPGPFPVVSSSGITSYHDRWMVEGPGVVTGRKGKLGDAYYLEGPFWPHDTSLWVKDFHGNDRRFAAVFIKALRLDRFDAATSVPTLNRNFVHPLPVVVPAVADQRQIVATLAIADHRLSAECEQLAKWRVLKAGLMDDLLTGRVRVTPLLAGARL